MAHEISHILIAAEDRRHQGDIRDWWTPLSLQKYHEHASCLSKQFLKFSEPGFDKVVSNLLILYYNFVYLFYYQFYLFYK